MQARCLMGDYSFGISSNVTALSAIEYQQNKNGGKSYYGDPHTIPEELLMDKANPSAGDKQSDPQLQSPNGKDLISNGDGNMDEFTNCKSKGEDIDLSCNNQMEKHMIETSSTSGIPSSHLQLEFPDAVITTSAPSFWAGVTGEDQFNPCVPPPMKNPLSFQNFPNSPNPMFNSSLGPQINIPQSLPPQRRAITGAHNFSQSRHQQPQSNILKTFSNWTNPQNASWSAPQTPNEMLPWNAMNLTNQKRTVPNMNPVCPQKKNSPIGQHSMVISPSKFRRSTSLPLNKQYPHSFGGNPPFDMSTLEENREGNMMFPFQDHQMAGNMNTNSMEALRFPLEQQLLDIMRTSNAENQDHFKGYVNYATNNIQSIGNMQDICMIMYVNSGCKSSLSDFRINDLAHYKENRRNCFSGQT